MNGSKPRIIKRCLKPWDEKWGVHREIGKVLHYNKVCEHFELMTTDGGELMNI